MAAKKTTQTADKSAAPKKAATKKAAPAKAAASAPTNGGAKHEPTHDEIRQRAYEIHLASGGRSFDNWLQAERELRGS